MVGVNKGRSILRAPGVSSATISPTPSFQATLLASPSPESFSSGLATIVLFLFLLFLMFLVSLFTELTENNVISK
jgi:hypothetical protein